MRGGEAIAMFRMTELSNPTGRLILALEGSVGADALPEITRQIKNGKQSRRQVALDLGEVTLLDRAAVRFFAGQLKRGVELMNCPVYIKHWISREASHVLGGVHNSLLMALAGLALLSNACMIGPKYQRPTAVAPAAYKEPPPAGWKEAQPNDGAIRGKWWEIYNEPQLNALEQQVSITNQNVLAAEAKFRQAKAAVRVARAGLFPTVTTTPSVAVSQSPANFTNTGQVSATARVRELYALPFNFTYQADVWGNVRRSIAANSATAQASAADLENARLLYQSELANDYFELRGLDGEAQLLDATVRSYDEFLTLTKNRYASGVASMGDVAQAETQLETTRAQLIDLGVQRAQFEHAIAILAGQPPTAVSISLGPIKGPPPPVPIGVPSALLERRPDIASFERQVAAANEQIGIAQVAFYPSLTLSAVGGFESSKFANWFTWPSRFWSVGPQLAQTLFEGGRRRALVDEAKAAYDVTVANYRQTVLTAFQQVEDNLVALRILEEEAGVQDRAVKAAEESLTISTNQYRGGVVSYLQVITSQAIALQDERTAVGILTRRMSASVLLIQALGGGWDAPQLPTANDILPPGKKKASAGHSD
jgi:NodT family efflux transporter outer membrane factor (OMF) lipoprotein